jgi:flagellar hook-basal body complex protein FliE
MYLRPVSMASVTPVIERTAPKIQGSADAKTSFTNVLQQAATTLDALDREAVQSQIDLVSGNARDMHTATLTAEKASLALDLVVSVRNKAIEAYQEIMRMPV